MITVGILGAYIVALVVLRTAPGSAATVGWRLILGLGAVPALIGLVLRTTMPESPRWLMRQGRFDKAQEALASFGVQVSAAAIEASARRFDHEDERQERRHRQVSTPGVERALLVVCTFFLFQQITGINVPLYYGPHLLGPIFEGDNSSVVSSTIAGVEVTSIMTAVNVAATYFGFRYIDRIGRRRLAMGGYLGMAVFAVVAAAGLGFVSGTARLVLVMVGLDFLSPPSPLASGGRAGFSRARSSPPPCGDRRAPLGATVAGWRTLPSLKSFLCGRLVDRSGLGSSSASRPCV